MRRVLRVASRAIQAQLARRVARWGRRAGKVLAVVALAWASLLVTGSSGKLGVECLDVRQDRHVRGGAGAIRARLARSWRLVSSSSPVVSWLTSWERVMLFQDAVDDLAAAGREEVGPFLAQRVDEDQAAAAFGVVIGAGQDRRIVIGVVNLDEQALAEMPQG